jgi:MFS family permease
MPIPSYKAYKYRWAVLTAYMYIAALSQLFWLNFTTIETFTEKNLNVSAMLTGWLALVFPLVYVLLSIPSGIIIDKKGFRFGVGLGAAFTGVFALLRVFGPHSYPLLLYSQIGIAVGQPFILNGITKLVVVWFSPKEEATAIGLGSLSMILGMMIGVGLTPVLVDSLGFEEMLVVYGVLGVMGILLFFLFIKSQPRTPVREMESATLFGWRGIGSVLKNRNFVILGFIALIGIGVFNGLATWLEKILNELHGISMVDAGTVSAVLIFSGMLGCLIIPMISDRLGRRKPFLLTASLLGTIGVIIFIYQSSLMWSLIAGILIGFFLLSALPIMLTMSVEITGTKTAGISAAYLQLLGNAAAVVIVPLMETIRGVKGTPVYSLVFLAVLLFAAFILSTRVKETGHARGG